VHSTLVIGCLNSNGTPDTGFDADGLFVVSENIFPPSLISLVIQPFDGKIIIASSITSSAGNEDFLIARINSFGTLDTSYGTNGIVTITVGPEDVCPSIDLEPDGQLILAGISRVGFTRYLTVQKINTDGTLVSLPVGLYGPFNAGNVGWKRPIVKCSNGQILVAAENNLLRFSDIDTGAYQQTYYYTCSGTSAIVLKPDQTIFTVGYALDWNNQASISVNNFDASWNNVSSTQTNLATGFDRLVDVVEQPNGKTISLVGTKIGGFTYDSVLVRRNSNGNVDTLFGTDGTGVVDTGILNPYRLVKQSDGKLLISTTDGYIVRYTADGLLDTGFANAGTLDFSQATTSVVSFVDNLYTTADGKIYVVFDYWFNDKLNVGVYRINNDGSIDTTFGVDGIASLRFDYLSADEYEWPNAIYIDANTKITVGCSINYNGTWIPGIARFNLDGSLDTTFGTNGQILYTNQTGTYYFPYTITPTLNNKLLVNGQLNNNQIISRLNIDGTLDATFGTNGTVTVPVSHGCMAVQPDGKILYSYSDVIKRLNSDGAADPSFGSAGVLNTQIYSLYNHSIDKLLLTQNNKLLEAGYTYNGSKYIATLLRYTDLNLGTLAFTTDATFLVYPNPVVDKTQFKYTLAEDASVTIQLLTMEGQVIKEILSNQNQPAGAHEQTVEMNDLSVGNYLLLFSSPKGKQAIKLIKAK
jgi:uncharacterized delta-60 repeat protein